MCHPNEALNKMAVYNIGNRVWVFISQCGVCLSSALPCERATGPFLVYGTQWYDRESTWKSLARWWIMLVEDCVILTNINLEHRNYLHIPTFYTILTFPGWPTHFLIFCSSGACEYCNCCIFSCNMWFTSGNNKGINLIEYPSLIFDLIDLWWINSILSSRKVYQGNICNHINMSKDLVPQKNKLEVDSSLPTAISGLIFVGASSQLAWH